MLESADLHFNVDHGYLEGLVRGCKASLLTPQDYVNLVQCETLEGKWSLSYASERKREIKSLSKSREKAHKGIFIPSIQVSCVYKEKNRVYFYLFPQSEI